MSKWARCPVCGAEKEWVDCYQCNGEGGYHDCGEDCCPCADPEGDLNVDCDVCQGEGGYLECPRIGQHTDAQVTAFNRRLHWRDA